MKSARAVLFADKVLQGVVDPHSMGEEKATSGGEFMEEEEVLFATYSAVVAFGGFGEEGFVFCHLFFFGETDTVDSLEGIILGVS